MILYYDLTIAYRSQRAECSDLNENSSHRLIYFKVWLPVGGLLRKDQEVWPCYMRCVTSVELSVLKPISGPASLVPAAWVWGLPCRLYSRQEKISIKRQERLILNLLKHTLDEDF